jgi:hypothetical protein
MCGVDDFVGMAAFCKAKRKWFSKYLDLSNGIPSHDRINAVFAMLKPEFVETQIAIDGKSLRNSFDKASGKSALHMVHAWGKANGMVWPPKTGQWDKM